MEDTLLIVDTSDLIKKYATKMENLAEARDSSDKKIGYGCRSCRVVAARCGKPEIVHLYHVLYSQKTSDFVSENHELLTAINETGRAVGNRGIFLWIEVLTDKLSTSRWCRITGSCDSLFASAGTGICYMAARG